MFNGVEQMLFHDLRARQAVLQRFPQGCQIHDEIEFFCAFRKRLNDRGDIDPEEWRPYFVDHEQYDLWQAAEVRTRSAFVELLGKDTAGELLEEIGGTMLDDPDIDVRLALLKALVRSGLKKVVPFIDRRLGDIEEDASINPDQADRERKALLQAKDKLRKGRRKRENPWDP